MSKWRQWLGWEPTEEDKKDMKRYKNAYKSLRVVGRGTLIADIEEVEEKMVKDGWLKKVYKDDRESSNLSDQ